MVVDARSRRIEALSSQIVALSAELHNLLLSEDDTPVPVPPEPPAVPVPPVAPPSSDTFVVGSRVQILNRYRGLQGSQGTVTRVTRVFIYLRLDSGRSTSRQRSNLRILSNPSQ